MLCDLCIYGVATCVSLPWWHSGEASALRTTDTGFASCFFPPNHTSGLNDSCGVVVLLLVRQMETLVSSMNVAVHCRSPRLL